MRSTGVVAAAVCLALATGCSGETPAPDAEPRTSPTRATSTPPPPPTPAQALGLAGGWGPSDRQLDAAARRARRMPLRDLAGQVIVASYRGTAAPVGLVRSLHLGGVIVFADNVVSARQVAASNRRLRRAAGRPLVVSVDQEGGVVERIGSGATRFPAFMSTGAAGDADLTRATYRASGAELAGLGFTMDFAPDADVTIGPADPVIGSRSASDDPRVVAEQAVAAAQGFLAGGVVPVLKHFPGHGSVTTDSHVALPVQGASLHRLGRRDYVPFRAAARAGLPAIMVGHIAVPQLRPGMPASLSRRAVHGQLRRELGFDGVVISDALDMAAVAGRFDSADSAVRALDAGVDVLLMPPDPRAARQGIVRAVRRGVLDRTRVEQAAARLLALLAHQRAESAGSRPPRPEAVRRASRRLSAAAVTMVAGPCGQRVVGGAVAPVGDPGAVAAFAAAASQAGLEVLLRRAAPAELVRAEPAPVRARKEKRPAFRTRLRAWRDREATRRGRLADWEAAEDARLARGTGIGFSGYGGGTYGGQVAVATDTPYVLGRATAPVRIATYGETPGAMSVLVEVLLGRLRAPGRLPVSVAGAPRPGCG